MLIEREKGQFIRFRANPDYYDGAPAVDELTFRVYKNGDAVAQALRKGEIDFADELQANVFDAIKDEQGITAVNAAYYGFNQIGMNVGAALADGTPIGDGNPALKDKRVRQAINHAIDRQTLVDKVPVYGTPGSTIIPPLYAALHLQPTTLFDYDPARAGELLDEAGYPLGRRRQARRSGRRAPDPSPAGPPGVPDLPADGAVRRGVARGDRHHGRHQDRHRGHADRAQRRGPLRPLRVGLGRGAGPRLPAVDLHLRPALLEGGRHHLRGPVGLALLQRGVRPLYAEQALETDPAKRAEIVKEMQQIIYDEAPYAVTYYYDLLQAYAREIVKAMQQIVYDEAPYAITFYYDLLQAYRSDRFTNFVQQPKDAGPLLFQFGTWSYQSITPAGAEDGQAAGSSTDSGISPALLAGTRRPRGRGDRRGGPVQPAPVIRRGHRVGMGPAADTAADRPTPITAEDAATRSAGMSPGARYALRSVGSGLATLVFVVVFNFFLFRMLPGDPIGLYTRGRNVAPEQIAKLRAELDKPIGEQFLTYISNPFASTINSARFNRPVWELIGDRIGATLLLVGTAIVLASIIGTLIGIRAAWKRGERFDSVSSAVTLTLYAMPEFWLGMILLIMFGVGTAITPGIFPIGGIITPGVDPPASRAS